MDLKQEHLENAIVSLRHWLSRDPNIQAMHVGRKKVGGRETDQLAVIFEVEEKKPLHALGEDRIPPTLALHVQSPEGEVSEASVPTDVVEIGRLKPAVLDQRVRPTPGGYKITADSSWFSESAGTLGVNIVWGGRFRLLTNNHVISHNNNDGGTVYQPESALFGDNKLSTVAGYYPVITYTDRNKVNPAYNNFDLAWCDIDVTKGATNIANIGVPTGIRKPVAGETVRWIGQKTGAVQNATINSITGQVVMEFLDGQWAWFQNVIQLTGGVVQKGDSGSAIVATNDMNVVGLIFASNGLNQGYGCPIV
jgi:hypothetical protein